MGEEALVFVRKLIAHAMARDGSSGGVIRTVTMTKDETEDATVQWHNAPYSLEKNTQHLINPTTPVI
eukprot:NODE_12112_length_287_cov_18.991597_g11199_i0.p2 GENE.NODE_12112_length_287_cov_18.991597_g11199_i0~~NODE_12112_length_287_cov_18.991597_g11199_i0.p2  ORF type:complete len:74 (+),score=30.13 NODE_12112_length_287_cov_18.991597_g11199_i0:22-222(+)